MGGNKTNKQSNQMLTDQMNQENKGFNQFASRNETDLNQAKQHSEDLYGSIKSGYSALTDPNSAIDQSAFGGGRGGGGGISASTAGDPRFAESEGNYRNFIQTGGWDPNRVSNVDSDISGLRNIAKTGGVSDESIGRIRGGGVFDEFAKTGGLSDGDKQNIRTRATSVIPSLYANIKAQGDQASAVQGGYGPGRQAMLLKAARDQKSGIADASLSAELGITDKVNQGREWGASSMSGAEQGLASLQSQNKIAGYTGAGGLETGMEDSIVRGKEFGTQGLEGMAQSDRQAALQAASIGAGSSAASAQLKLQSYLAGLGGLQSLYSSSPTEYQEDKDFALKNRSLNDSSMTSLIGGRQQTGNGFWGSLGKALPGAAAAAFL